MVEEEGREGRGCGTNSWWDTEVGDTLKILGSNLNPLLGWIFRRPV